jgi:hypothetical protein
MGSAWVNAFACRGSRRRAAADLWQPDPGLRRAARVSAQPPTSRLATNDKACPLNQRVRGSSPWRRTPKPQVITVDDLRFCNSRRRYPLGLTVHNGRNGARDDAPTDDRPQSSRWPHGLPAAATSRTIRGNEIGAVPSGDPSMVAASTRIGLVDGDQIRHGLPAVGVGGWDEVHGRTSRPRTAIAAARGRPGAAGTAGSGPRRLFDRHTCAAAAHACILEECLILLLTAFLL